jgi:hypothetical protein
MITTHELKSWTPYFASINEGIAKFDLRWNDRKFRVGDIACFQEFEDTLDIFTGRVCERRITYIVEGVGPGSIEPLKGLMRGYVILSLEPLE